MENKTDQEIKELGEKWLGDKFHYITYEAHLTGFIEGFKEAFRQFSTIKPACDHDKVTIKTDDMGNTHYCKKCGLWNF